VKISDHVLHAIADADRGYFEPALLHACIAIDATARRLFPAMMIGARYVSTLRGYYWLLEPMIGVGLNLENTRFGNVGLKKNPNPDLAEIIYEIFRCNHAHGDAVPIKFSVTRSHGGWDSTWEIAHGELHMPDRVLWALLGIAVFSKANAGESTAGNAWLSLGDEHFPIAEWWGREDDFRPIATRYNTRRVKLEGLERLIPPAA
jgi:hypothetical protein